MIVIIEKHQTESNAMKTVKTAAAALDGSALLQTAAAAAAVHSGDSQTDCDEEGSDGTRSGVGGLLRPVSAVRHVPVPQLRQTDCTPHLSHSTSCTLEESDGEDIYSPLSSPDGADAPSPQAEDTPAESLTQQIMSSQPLLLPSGLRNSIPNRSADKSNPINQEIHPNSAYTNEC